jgi:hypothetical protein
VIFHWDFLRLLWFAPLTGCTALAWLRARAKRRARARAALGAPLWLFPEPIRDHLSVHVRSLTASGARAVRATATFSAGDAGVAWLSVTAAPGGDGMEMAAGYCDSKRQAARLFHEPPASVAGSRPAC